MKKATVVLVALACAADAAFAQKILEHKDSFSNTTKYFTESREVRLEGGSFLSGRYVNFDLMAYYPIIDPQKPYGIDVRTLTSDWIFISAGPSLILKLDGEEAVVLTGSGSQNARDVITANSLQEQATWWLSEEQLKRIAQAKKVEFRILGDKQVITGLWKPDLLHDAAYFASEISKFVKPEAPLVAAIVEQAKAESQTVCPAIERPAALGAPVKLGIKFVSINKKIADMTRFEGTHGVFVMEAVTGSAAETSGIKAGDILTKFGESDIPDRCAVFAALATTSAGTTVPVAMWRQGSGKWTANVTFKQEAQAPAPAGIASRTSQGSDLYSELTKLDELRRKGILTQEEFDAQKQKLLHSQ